MIICFVLGQPELGGGVKVVFQLAALAQSLGHSVEVHGIGPMPEWARTYYPGIYRNRRDTLSPRHFDLAIATYYTTVDVAEQLDASRVVHFCQGYEGDFEHLASQRQYIESVYQRSHCLFTVNPYLGKRLARDFHKSWCFVPPPVDPVFRPAIRFKPHHEAIIAISGNFEVIWKGVETCLKAVNHLRHAGHNLRVMRYSLLPQSDREITLLPDSQFIHAAAPEVVAAGLRQCDLLLQGSTGTEGFGLPAMEAALSGVPVVCTDLPAMRLLGIPAQYRVPVGDDRRMAKAAQQLLTSTASWKRTRIQNLGRVRARFSSAAIARRLQQALLWAEQIYPTVLVD